MDILTLIGSLIGLIFVVVIVAMAFIALDLISYAARGSSKLSSSGTENVLVVYSPGLSGAAKKAANDIGQELKSKGYEVDLAGVRSKNAAKISNYDILIAGGPMYWGKVSKSIDKYLKALKVSEDMKIGVFGTTGSSEFNEGDMATLEKQVTSSLNRKVVTKTLRSGEANKKDCADFVSAIIS